MSNEGLLLNPPASHQPPSTTTETGIEPHSKHSTTARLMKCASRCCPHCGAADAPLQQSQQQHQQHLGTEENHRNFQQPQISLPQQQQPATQQQMWSTNDDNNNNTDGAMSSGYPDVMPSPPPLLHPNINHSLQQNSHRSLYSPPHPPTTATEPQPYYYYPPPLQQQPLVEEERASFSLAGGSPQQLAVAVTVGSFVGLTAAAAVRWLNGGDFCWFPPAATVTTTTSASSRLLPRREGGKNHSERTAAPDTDRELPSAHVSSDHQQILEAVQAETEKQTMMLQRLVEELELQQQQQKSQEQADITNQSMDLLRRQHDQPNQSVGSDRHRDVGSLLRQIKEELSAIREALVSAETAKTLDDPLLLQSQLSAAIAKLDATLDNDGTAHGDTDIKITSDTLGLGGSIEIPVKTEAFTSGFPSTTTDPAILNPMHATMATLGSSTALRDAIGQLVRDNPSEQLVAGAQLLYLYVVNVSSHPRVPRYRKIYCNNESFQRHVAELRGARELLASVGFVEQQQKAVKTQGKVTATYWEWLPPSVNNVESGELQPSPHKAWLSDSEEIYLQRLKEAASALCVIKIAATTNKDELTELALSAAGISVTDEVTIEETNIATAAATPPRTHVALTTEIITYDAKVNGTPIADPSLYQTPLSKSILSPPVTKKNLTSPPADFPSLEHPLVKVETIGRYLSLPTDSFPEEVESTQTVSSSSESHADAAESALWK